METYVEEINELEKVPVHLPTGSKLLLSSGEHNVLLKKIIEDFLPIFGMGAELLYVGDTEDKDLFVQRDKLWQIGFTLTDTSFWKSTNRQIM